jgi:hypothetical protein
MVPSMTMDWGQLLLAVAVLFILLLLSILYRASLRRFVIRIAELFSIISVVLATVVGTISAYGWASLNDAWQGTYMPVIIAVLGGIGGLVSAAIVFAFLFVMIEIAENTRKP